MNRLLSQANRRSAMYWAARRLGLPLSWDSGVATDASREETIRKAIRCRKHVIAGHSDRHGSETWGEWWKRITGEEIGEAT